MWFEVVVIGLTLLNTIFVGVFNTIELVLESRKVKKGVEKERNLIEIKNIVQRSLSGSSESV